ncbi:MAG: DUF1467 family protein [Alphaproteobacteria bacterium]|nr:MAG: DUF1467 family protein [Alphaproteobacteria bacterium]
MTLAGGIVVFFISWFLVLFMVLPWGNKTHAESGEEQVPGTADSAPVKPRIWTKFAVTTLIAAAIFGIVWWVLYMQFFDLRAYFQNY